jgi:hypothetical protein
MVLRPGVASKYCAKIGSKVSLRECPVLRSDVSRKEDEVEVVGGSIYKVYRGV